MSSTPSSPLPLPLGINYDSDEDMNIDFDNNIARGQDIDADGESIDEEANVDHLHNAVHNDTHLSSTVQHHSVSFFLIVAPLVPYSSNRIPKIRYGHSIYSLFPSLRLIYTLGLRRP